MVPQDLILRLLRNKNNSGIFKLKYLLSSRRGKRCTWNTKKEPPSSLQQEMQAGVDSYSKVNPLKQLVYLSLKSSIPSKFPELPSSAAARFRFPSFPKSSLAITGRIAAFPLLESRDSSRTESPMPGKLGFPAE